MKPLFIGYPFGMRLFLTAISFLFLTACSGTPVYQAYEGEARAESEDALFKLPAAFNLLAVDGAKYSRVSIKDGATIKVLPGVHEYLIEYQDFWESNGDDFEKVTSKPIAIRFTAEKGKQYTIDFGKIENVEQSQAFADKPKIAIIDRTNGQSVAAEIKYNRYTGSFLGSLFGPSTSAPSQPAFAPRSQPAPAAPATNKPATNRDGKALEMLKYWWETADKAQQDSFQTWLKNQPQP
jgi:uncharacterized protein YccT (UPF0319 family)